MDAAKAMIERFPQMTRSAFAFLEAAGFRLVNSVADQLLYESAKAFVVITWDSRSGELNAFVGLIPRTGQAQDEYSLSDVMSEAGLPESECLPAQVADESRLKPFVDKLAVDLRERAQRALAGDRMYYRRLDAYRGARAEAYMRDMKLRQVRSEAEEAWRQRQYDRVANLYGSVESCLTEAESRKLEYAMQHRSV